MIHLFRRAGADGHGVEVAKILGEFHAIAALIDMLTCPEDLHSHDTGPAFLEFVLDRNDFLWRSIQGRTERIDARKGDLSPI